MKKCVAEGQMLDEKKTLKLDYKQTFRVGLAFAIIIMFWNAYDFVVPLLLEHAYGLPDWARGLVMGLDNLLSLFMLPLFGKLSDKGKGKLSKKYGRRTPYIVLGTLVSVALMVFVPVATLKQQQKTINLENSVDIKLNNDVFMTETLGQWYDNAKAGKEGAINYCDLKYLEANNITREDFVAIRFDADLTSKKAVLIFGAETFFYKGVEVTDMNAYPEGSSKTYKQIKEGNAEYKKYVASGMNTYKSDLVFKTITQTAEGKGSLGVYMVILLMVLVAMATFRSPAVALMPDVTPKPLRSQANAIINLMGGVGGAVSFLIYTIVLFNTKLENYVIIFASVAGGMLLFLAGFLALVNERKMVKRCEEICKEYGIDEDGESEMIKDASAIQNDIPAVNATMDAAEIAEQESESVQYNEVLEIAKAKTAKKVPLKQRFALMAKDDKAKLTSFVLILASIFMWFMGYNAITSNLSIYITKALNLSAGIASIINGVSMAVSAIAFIPVGYLAAAIGRRKTVIVGYVMTIISFLLIFFVVKPSENATIPAALFALFYLIAGFGLIIINVNTFPMVTELSTADTVGQFTGYYYMATMSAQAITPFLVGFVMEHISNKGLFIYAACFIAVAIILMLFVKHGDSKPIKGKKLTKEEHKQLMLDSMNDAD